MTAEFLVWNSAVFIFPEFSDEAIFLIVHLL